MIFLLCDGKTGILVLSFLYIIDIISSNEMYSVTEITDDNLLVEAGKYILDIFKKKKKN